MREESQLEDMRSAIRGDFERLAERRGSQELLHLRSSEESEESAATPVAQPETVSWLARLLGR